MALSMCLIDGRMPRRNISKHIN